MIEFHEDEYFHSPLEEDTLRILLSFLPREEYDKLLYRSEPYVRYYYRGFTRPLEKRIQLNRIRHSRFRLIEAKEIQKEDRPFLALASG